jgi:hypothetical protein
VVVIISADFSRDCESGRDGEADAAHLSEVGSFASQQGFHGSVTICLTCSEIINVLDALVAFGCHSFLGSLDQTTDVRDEYIGLIETELIFSE